MSKLAIKVEGLSKMYRLGEYGTKTLSEDVSLGLRRLFGKNTDSFRDIAENDRTSVATSSNVWALRDINFEVEQGGVIGIIGRNGAGKSTLLKILSRVTGPTEGTIKLQGKTASLLEVGTGFQQELTGRENIYLNGAILGMTKRDVDRKIDEIIDFAGVSKYVDTPVKRYSSGMKVRLGFAVAAHLEPDILIVDEVLAVGDLEFQKKAIGKMQDVSSDSGRTVLFVSHNMASIGNLCKSAILLNNGMIEMIDNTPKVIEAYINQNEGLRQLELKQRKDRKGEGAIRFSNYKILSGDNLSEVALGISGKPIRIVFELEAKEEIQHVVVSVGFFSKEGTLYSACRSDAVSKEFTLRKGANELEFIYNNLPLSAGTYSMNVVVYSRNIMQDWIQDIGYLDVENGDFYGTGKLPNINNRSVLTHFDWQMKHY